MSDVYRLGFESSIPVEQISFDDTQWSLVGLRCDLPVRTGRFAASDGENVPYRLWPANKSRALILLLHGAFDYSGAFDQIGPAFAERGITAIAIDQRGFGTSSTRGKWGDENRMTRDAIDAIGFARERFGGRLPVFVLGESMGAALAVLVASRPSDLLLAGLVLAAPGAVSGPLRGLLGALAMGLLRFFFPQSTITIRRLSAWEIAPASAIRLMGDPLVLRYARPAALFGLFKLARRAVQEAVLVHIPVLTLAGASDDVLRLACIARLHERLAGTKEWICFKQAPHLLLHWKHNHLVLTKVYSWIDARLAECLRIESEVDRLRLPICEPAPMLSDATGTGEDVRHHAVCG